MREAIAANQTHIQIVVARRKSTVHGSKVRLFGRGGPTADPDKTIAPAGQGKVSAWFDLVSLRLWLESISRRRPRRVVGTE